MYFISIFKNIFKCPLKLMTGSLRQIQNEHTVLEREVSFSFVNVDLTDAHCNVVSAQAAITTQYRRLGNLNNRNLFLKVIETRSATPGYQQGLCRKWEHWPLVPDDACTLCPHMVLPPCVSHGEIEEASCLVVPLIRTLIHHEGPTLMTPSKTNFQSSNMNTLGVRAPTDESGGSTV